MNIGKEQAMVLLRVTFSIQLLIKITPEVAMMMISDSQHRMVQKVFFMSLIPGVGQLYKGSKLKGGLILGGTVACAGMIIASENMRSSYIKKMQEKPVHKAFYNDKADLWCNVRNGFIGATAALYVYNLIDAAVAPGRRRVIVKEGNSIYFSFFPSWNQNMTGLSLVMNF